jgi:hypothetical protein
MSVRHASLIGLLFAGVLMLSNQAHALGDRYMIGDGLGTSTVQVPRPSLWSGPGTEANFQGDSVFAGRMSFQCLYDLNAPGTDGQPAKWNGFGWYFGANVGPQDMAGATYLRLAYKLPNPKHTLRINLNCSDTSVISGYRDTTIVDTSKNPDSSWVRHDTLHPTAYPYAFLPGGVGTAGKDGWKIDSIDLSLTGPFGSTLILKGINQLDVNQVWMDSTSTTIDTTGGAGIIELDEICFVNVSNGTIIPLKQKTLNSNATTGLTFMPKSTGSVMVKYYTMSGGLLSSVKMDVIAGKSCTLSQQTMQHAAGAYLVHVTGAGVDLRSKIAR